MKKIYSWLALFVLVISASIALNPGLFVKLKWKLLYGRSLKWAGANIAIGPNEYFMPPLADGNSLFIRGDDSRALIFLKRENISIDELRALADKDCAVRGCVRVKERLCDVSHVRVVSFGYLTNLYQGSMWNQHVLVEGSGIWAQYIGPWEEYENHKATLDNLARTLVTNDKRTRSSDAAQRCNVIVR